ncbi:hypothetical protein L209DRAFT_773528 [Thermothelomyces heterothallicus CBS 203.75]
MTDLLHVLPHFPAGQFARLIPVLEKHGLSTSDLLTLEAADIGKRTRLPLLDVKRLCSAVLDALHADLGVANPAPGAHLGPLQPEPDRFTGPSSADFGTPASSLQYHHQHHHYHSLQSGPRPTQESPLATRSRRLPPISGNSNSTALADILPPSSVPLPSSSHPQSDEPEPTAPPPPPPPPPPLPTDPDPPRPSHPALLLDHQQRWFTGWGDDPSSNLALKTPALGLVWTTQIAGRIALFRRPVPLRRRRPVHDHHHPRSQQHHDDSSSSSSHRQAAGLSGSGIATGWERLMKVVFAPHVAGTGPGLDGAVRFEVWMGGLRGLGGAAAAAELGTEKEGKGEGEEDGGDDGDDNKDEKEQKEEEENEADNR